MQVDRSGISRMVGSLWDELDDEGRRPYHDMAARDREQYERELAQYGAGYANGAVQPSAAGGSKSGVPGKGRAGVGGSGLRSRAAARGGGVPAASVAGRAVAGRGEGGGEAQEQEETVGGDTEDEELAPPLELQGVRLQLPPELQQQQWRPRQRGAMSRPQAQPAPQQRQSPAVSQQEAAAGAGQALVQQQQLRSQNGGTPALPPRAARANRAQSPRSPLEQEQQEQASPAPADERVASGAQGPTRHQSPHKQQHGPLLSQQQEAGHGSGSPRRPLAGARPGRDMPPPPAPHPGNHRREHPPASGATQHPDYPAQRPGRMHPVANAERGSREGVQGRSDQGWPLAEAGGGRDGGSGEYGAPAGDEEMYDADGLEDGVNTAGGVGTDGMDGVEGMDEAADVQDDEGVHGGQGQGQGRVGGADGGPFRQRSRSGGAAPGAHGVPSWRREHPSTLAIEVRPDPLGPGETPDIGMGSVCGGRWDMREAAGEYDGQRAYSPLYGGQAGEALPFNGYDAGVGGPLQHGQQGWGAQGLQQGAGRRESDPGYQAVVAYGVRGFGAPAPYPGAGHGGEAVGEDGGDYRRHQQHHQQQQQPQQYQQQQQHLYRHNQEGGRQAHLPGMPVEAVQYGQRLRPLQQHQEQGIDPAGVGYGDPGDDPGGGGGGGELVQYGQPVAAAHRTYGDAMEGMRTVGGGGGMGRGGGYGALPLPRGLQANIPPSSAVFCYLQTGDTVVPLTREQLAGLQMDEATAAQITQLAMQGGGQVQIPLAMAPLAVGGGMAGGAREQCLALPYRPGEGEEDNGRVGLG